MVTAEAALVLPVLVLVLAGALSVLTVLGAQVRCVDAAREGVRAAARGEDQAVVVALAADAAPDGADVVVEAPAPERVRVTVSASVRPLGGLPWTVQVRSSALARTEPGSRWEAG